MSQANFIGNNNDYRGRTRKPENPMVLTATRAIPTDIFLLFSGHAIYNWDDRCNAKSYQAKSRYDCKWMLPC